MSHRMHQALLAIGLLLGLSALPGASLAESESEGKPRGGSIDWDDAVAHGNGSDQRWVSLNVLVLDEEVSRKVQEIGERLAAASGGPEISYTFRVLNSPVVNAFATSGGFIYVHAGLLDLLESEDELAAVLAHEIVHNNEDHLLRRIRTDRFSHAMATVAGVVLSAVLQSVVQEMAPAPSPYGTGYSSQDLSNLVGFAGDLGRGLPLAIAEISVRGYAKGQELDADVRAVDYMRAAGYNPHAMVNLLKKMASMRRQLDSLDAISNAAWFNKKPGLEERIKQAETVLSGAGGNPEGAGQ